MQLDNFFIRQTRLAVQPVDILCDEADKLALLVQRLNKIVADIGFGVLVLFPAFESRFQASMRAASLLVYS